MKIKNIILVLCTSLTFCSCSDWLDVSPNNQVDGEICLTLEMAIALL